MLSSPSIVLDTRNLSFAGAKLTILRPLSFHGTLSPVHNLIFLHPPKTGGTNLCFIGDALSVRDPNFKAVRFPVPRVPNQSPNLVTLGWVGGLRSALAALSQDSHFCQDKNFMSGHFPFGLHERIAVPAQYITLIRNPIVRTISSTNFDYQRGYVLEKDAERYLLEADIDNPQTRMLAGEGAMTGICNEETLALAKKNIEKHFLLAGVTEETELFIQVLASIQGWGTLALAKSQVTAKKVITNPSQEIIDQLSAKHQFDLRLYSWVKARWEGWKEKNINFAHVSERNSQEKILCVTCDFASSRQPLFMTQAQIEEYNEGKAETALVEVNQGPTQVVGAQSGPSPAILRQYQLPQAPVAESSGPYEKRDQKMSAKVGP